MADITAGKVSTQKVKKSGIKLLGMEIQYFAVFAAIVLAATYLGVLPKGMGSALAFTIVLGAVWGWIGDHTPIVKDYFGGASVAIIFGCAAMATYGFIPKDVAANVKNFFSGDMNFTDFLLAILITGSIFGTNREMLKKAAARFVPVLIGAQVFVMIFAAVGALITGQDIKETVLYIALPITSGGMSAGAIPLSKIYQGTLGINAEQTLSIMAPSIALANAVAIISAGIIANLVKKKPKLTGYGKLMPLKQAEGDVDEDYKFSDYKQLAPGFLVCFSLLILGYIISKFIPQFHAYAYMVILAVVVKVTGLLPKQHMESAVVFYECFISVCRNVILACIGIVLINLTTVFSLVTPAYLIIVVLCGLGAFTGAAIGGKLVGFYPVESGIAAGLCSADMGGTGDLAILGAANRMELLPFSTIATRIGGAIILIVASLVSGLLA
jgi:malate:Na+ symporter